LEFTKAAMLAGQGEERLLLELTFDSSRTLVDVDLYWPQETGPRL